MDHALIKRGARFTHKRWFGPDPERAPIVYVIYRVQRAADKSVTHVYYRRLDAPGDRAHSDIDYFTSHAFGGWLQEGDKA